uniref:MSP domain-containing protein n=1 Tax=Ciona savignyi TaxID=51511 RepID=H2YD32_CIOSA
IGKSKSAVKACQKLADLNKSPEVQNTSPVRIKKQKLPVYVSTEKVTFYLNDPTTHSRILTVYNPYDFPVCYKVLCTAPKKYTVGEDKGTIKQHSCCDIVIRRTSLDKSLLDIVDQFRLEVYYGKSSSSSRKLLPTSLLGVKNISSVLLSEVSAENTQVKAVPTSISKIALESLKEETDKQEVKGEFLSSRWLLVSVAIACLFALGAHTAGQVEDNSIIPISFSLTSNQKLVAAYILGLVTMAIFNPL